jgi:hypothetical protein
MTLLAQQMVLLQESAARNVGVRTIRENQTCAEEHSMKHLYTIHWRRSAITPQNSTSGKGWDRISVLDEFP